jgi:hypothetical protein
MQTIYKYPVELGATQLMLPPGALVERVDWQSGDFFAWVLLDRALVDTGDQQAVTVNIVGTGHDVPPDAGDYVSTFFEHGGLYVWHAFAHYDEEAA